MKKKAGAGSAEAAKQVRQALTSRGRGRLQVLERALVDGTAIDRQLLDAYVEALRDRYGDLVRLIATRILPAFGAAAVAKLRPRLNLKGKGADGWALVALALADRTEGVAVCRQALDAGNPAVRQAALVALTELSPEEAVAAAVVLLEGGNDKLRAAATRTLFQLGPLAESSIPALIRGLGDRVWEVRWRCGHTLARLGTPAVAPLMNVLKKGYPLGWEAVLALGEMGPVAAPAVPLLIELVNDFEPMIVRAVVVALGRIGPAAQAAIGAIQQGLASLAVPDRVRAVVALHRITG